MEAENKTGKGTQQTLWEDLILTTGTKGRRKDVSTGMQTIESVCTV